METTVGELQRTPKLAIFDKDGTLICIHKLFTPWCIMMGKMYADFMKRKDFEDDVHKALGYDKEKQTLFPALIANWQTHLVQDGLIELLVKEGVTEKEARSFVMETYTEIDTTDVTLMKPLGDIKRIFSTLKERGIKIAICTADFRDGTEAMVKHLGLENLVDFTLCAGDEEYKPKPAPDNILHICKELNISPKDTIMIGDTCGDIQMGKGADVMAAIGVTSGVYLSSDLKRDADMVLSTVEDVLFTLPQN